jgi:putative ABC transport system permease protein
VDSTVWRFWDATLGAVRGIPGVVSAGVASQLPLGGNVDRYGVHPEDRPNPNPELDPSAERYGVSPDFIATMGIPLLRGRGITRDDDERSPMVAVINRAMADQVFAGMDPIGRRFRTGGTDGPWRTVIGVAGNSRHQSLDAPDEYQMYLPMTQWDGETMMTLVVRTAVPPATLAPALRAAVRSVNAGAAIAKVSTLDDLVAASAAQRQFALVLFEAFAFVALVLAGAGIFGVLAAGVAERTREIGIRTALGAPQERILGLVVRQGVVLTTLGFVLGIAGTLSLSRVIAKLLYDVRPYDPWTMVTVAAALAAIAVTACAVPAWRAVRVDPMVALRGEG